MAHLLAFLLHTLDLNLWSQPGDPRTLDATKHVAWSERKQTPGQAAIAGRVQGWYQLPETRKHTCRGTSEIPALAPLPRWESLDRQGYTRILPHLEPSQAHPRVQSGSPATAPAQAAGSAPPARQ